LGALSIVSLTVENPQKDAAGEASLHRQQGSAYLNQRSFGLAIAEFEKSLSLNPDWLAWIGKNDLPRAASQFRRVLHLAPKRSETGAR
jgi:hypothetical protein